MTKPTICLYCNHYRRSGSGKVVWYEQRCAAVHEQPVADYVNGYIPGPKDKGEMKYCRDVNNGNCQFFQPVSLVTRGLRLLH